jgi:hypothetical protein
MKPCARRSVKRMLRLGRVSVPPDKSYRPIDAAIPAGEFHKHSPLW